MYSFTQTQFHDGETKCKCLNRNQKKKIQMMAIRERVAYIMDDFCIVNTYHAACFYGQLHLVKFFLEDCSSEIPESVRNHMLHDPFYLEKLCLNENRRINSRPYYEIVEYLIEKHGIDFRYFPKLLYWTAKYNRVKMVDLLIEKGNAHDFRLCSEKLPPDGIKAINMIRRIKWTKESRLEDCISQELWKRMNRTVLDEIRYGLPISIEYLSVKAEYNSYQVVNVYDNEVIDLTV